jgi:glutamate synthase (NADPH/NADH) large chain
MVAHGSPQGFPAAQGLYDGQHEHDACGVAFVATLSGLASHDIVDQALTALRNLDHRGASGAEPDSGDGAGILTQVPDDFLRGVTAFSLPPKGTYAVGCAFLPDDDVREAQARSVVERVAREEGLQVLGWRDVPVTPSLLGATARRVLPRMRQLFVTAEDGPVASLALDRMAFCLRKRAEHEADVYFPSLSARTLVYKGMLTTAQLEPFFPDLADPSRALTVLDQHVPVLAAGSPLPDHRPQR